MYAYRYSYPSIVTTGGKLAPGVYASNSSGSLTYTKTGATQFTGVTFVSSYDVYWFEVLADGTHTAVNVISGNDLTAANPTDIVITGAESSATARMYLATGITIDATRNNDFTFLQSDIGNQTKISGIISGTEWGETLPASYITTRIDTVYIGSFTPPEGDYTHEYVQIDPNGVETTSSNSVTIRWAPWVFLKTIDSNANMRDAQPDVSGIESFNVEYVKGYNVLSDDSSPQYDANGELQTFDEARGIGQDILVSYPVGIAENDIQVTTISDDFGNTKDSDTKQVTRVPHITNNGATTIDEETFGTTYAATDILTIDAGLTEETTATPTEAPYSFTSGDYKVYNFTASYTYPSTTVSRTIAYDIDYKEFAVELYDIKIHEFLTDDFDFEFSQTSLTEPNYKETGLSTLNHRSTPTYVQDDTNTAYRAFTTDFDFNPTLGNVLETQTSNAPYLTGGISANLFELEQTWSVSVFFNSSGLEYLFGKAGSSVGQNTGVYLNNGNLDVYFGGTLAATVTTYSLSEWHHLVWKNFHNGVEWVDTLWLDGTAVYEERNTSRGIISNNLAPVFGGRWNITSQVDPATDSQSRTGAQLSALRMSNTEFTDKQKRQLFYRNNRYFVGVVNGSSTAFGTGTGYGGGWAFRNQTANSDFNRRVQMVNIAVSGTNFYQALPETPIGDWTHKPDWTGARISSSPTQSCEYVDNTFGPEFVEFNFVSNYGASDYYDKNPSGTGGSDITDKTKIGYDSFADEFLFGHLQAQDWYETNDIQFYWTGPSPLNSTDLKTEDLIPFRDAQRAVSDALVADTTLRNVYHGHPDLRTSDVDNNINPALDFDGTHVNYDGHTIWLTGMQGLSLSSIDGSRDFHFDPDTVITNPVNDQTVFMTPYPIVWEHDKTEENDTEDLVLGNNTVTRNYENSQGRTGQDSINLILSNPPSLNDYLRYTMEAIVSDEFVDLGSAGINAGIRGDKTIVGKQWACSDASGDNAYAPGTGSEMAVASEYATSIWINNTVGSGFRYIHGKHSSTAGARHGLYMDNTVLKWYDYGIAKTLKTGFTAALGRTHVGVQRRDSGGAVYVYDLYINGVFDSTIASTGSTTNSLPIGISGRYTSTTNPDLPVDFEFIGDLDNFRYIKSTLSTQNWADLYAFELNMV